MMAPTSEGRDFNPFPGLRPFNEEEEYLFFGRESQVDAMVNKLVATRFLVVVGSSGSGKSSLVNCGLRPALRRGLMTSAGTAWRMAQFRPAGEPVRALAKTLAANGVLFNNHDESGLPLVEIIDTTLRMSNLGLVDIYEQAHLPADTNLLVVVDQFEELFRYRQLGSVQQKDDFGPGEEATAFVNLLLQAAAQSTRPIYVAITMRSDFLGDCARFGGLAGRINVGQYLVPRMSRDERRCAITGPARVGGGEISPVLLTRLVNDVGDNPDQLSILQHALNRTWAAWQHETNCTGLLELSHYESIGTMAHALDRHAEKAYEELGDARHREVCEKIFKALTDKATDPRGVRRPTTFGTLCAVTDATEQEVTRVIEVFRKPSRSFLIPPSGQTLHANTVIDISHESLMRVWQRLVKWAEEEAQSAYTYRRLAETVGLHKKGDAGLWRQPDLGVALRWRATQKPNPAWAERYHPGFLEAMEFLEDSEVEERSRQAERARRATIKMTFFAGLVVSLLTGLLGWLLYAQYELQWQALELQARLRDEQAAAAQEAREQRTLGTLHALARAMPKDPERFAKMKGQLRSLTTNKTHRNIVSKLEESRPLDPDEESVLELYEALHNDDLLGARQIHLKLIRDSSKVPGVAKAAWKGWASVKKARNREIKLIGTLHDMRRSKAADTAIDELLRPWQTSSKLDERLFVIPVHFTVAKKLAEGQGLDPQEGLLCQLYSALESRAYGEADATLRHMAQATQALPDIIAAHSGKSFRSEARDRMLIVELHPSPGTPEGDPGRGALRGLLPVAIYRRFDIGRAVFRSVGGFGSSKQSEFSVYFDGNVLDKETFANPIHFEIACKLLVQRPDWKPGGHPVTCSDKVASTKFSQDEERMVEVYQTMDSEGKQAAVARLESFEKSNSSSPALSVHYLLASSSVGDQDLPTGASMFAKIGSRLDELKVVLVALLLWPMWEGWLWIRRRLGKPANIKLRASPMRRLLAGVTDLCIGVLLGAVIGGCAGTICWVITGAITGTYLFKAKIIGWGVMNVVGILVFYAYLLLRDAIKFKYHRSIGKIIFSLRPITVGREAGPVGLKVSAKRNAILAILVAAPWVIFEVHGFLLMIILFSIIVLVFVPTELILSGMKEGRTIHDRVGKTKVINVRSAEAQALDSAMKRSWTGRHEAALSV